MNVLKLYVYHDKQKKLCSFELTCVNGLLFKLFTNYSASEIRCGEGYFKRAFEEVHKTVTDQSYAVNGSLHCIIFNAKILSFGDNFTFKMIFVAFT